MLNDSREMSNCPHVVHFKGGLEIGSGEAEKK